MNIDTVRYNFFQELMQTLDNAEGETKSSCFGAFSYLKDKYYIRQIVCASHIAEDREREDNRGFAKKTGVPQLKNYLIKEVLQITGKSNKDSKVTAALVEKALLKKAKKKYKFCYDILDECSGNSYEFMERLRTVVWDKLRAFFELCNCESCSECEKKMDAYFKFMQAAALYEIFYKKFMYDDVIDNISEEIDKRKKSEQNLQEFERNLQAFIQAENKTKESTENLSQKVQELAKEVQEIQENRNNILEDMIEYLFLICEFGRSLSAILFLVLFLENVMVSVSLENWKDCDSTKMIEGIEKKYEKYLCLSNACNDRMQNRYIEIKDCLEMYFKNCKNSYDILEDYAKEICSFVEKRSRLDKNKNKEDYIKDYVKVIYAFMEELCKPKKEQNPDILYSLEWKLGYPIFENYS